MTDAEQVAQYREYVKKKLSLLTPIFANASIGDFSQDLEIPKEHDEFTDIFAGVNIMLEVIREQIDELQKAKEGLEQKVRERTRVLEEQKYELERMNELMVGRELKMIALKNEIEQMKSKK